MLTSNPKFKIRNKNEKRKKNKVYYLQLQLYKVPFLTQL